MVQIYLISVIHFKIQNGIVDDVKTATEGEVDEMDKTVLTEV